MKEDTTSFSLLPSILSSEEYAHKRLFFITGKGGVGKTTLAMALTKYLKEEEQRKVLYNSFNCPLSAENLKNLATLQISHFSLCLENSTKEYIARKIGSETAAKWIMKTPFFSSLLNILPGLADVILLGDILNRLENDPQLTIVIDSPSSGHTISIFESALNFKDIFRKGMIVKDIKRMEEFMHKRDLLQVFIAALPTQMATQEALELSFDLKKRKVSQIQFIINDLLSQNQNLLSAKKIYKKKDKKIPDLLQKKCKLESKVLKDLNPNDWIAIAHFISSTPEELSRKIATFWKEQKRKSLS